MTRHVAIIGAGYSGTLLAVQRAEAGWHVSLIERAPLAALGAAYATTERAHLLNVCANNMGAFADDAAGFAQWLSSHEVPNAHADDMYAARTEYGRYLRSLLDGACRRAGDRLQVVSDVAADVTEQADGMTVDLASGQSIQAESSPTRSTSASTSAWIAAFATEPAAPAAVSTRSGRSRAGAGGKSSRCRISGDRSESWRDG